MLCFHAAQTGKHLLRTQNVSEQNQKHFLCAGHKRGKIYCFGNNVSATMCYRLAGPLGTAVRDLNLPRRKMHQFTNLTLFRDHRLNESALICQTRFGYQCVFSLIFFFWKRQCNFILISSSIFILYYSVFILFTSATIFNMSI